MKQVIKQEWIDYCAQWQCYHTEENPLVMLTHRRPDDVIVGKCQYGYRKETQYFIEENLPELK